MVSTKFFQMGLKKDNALIISITYQIPLYDIVVVPNGYNLVWASPSHTGHQVTVLGILQIRCLEPHDCFLLSREKHLSLFCFSMLSMFVFIVTNNTGTLRKCANLLLV